MSGTTPGKRAGEKNYAAQRESIHVGSAARVMKMQEMLRHYGIIERTTTINKIRSVVGADAQGTWT